MRPDKISLQLLGTERVFVGLNPYGQVRAGVGILFSNQLRNHPTKSPNNVSGIHKQRWVSMGTIIPVFLP